MSEKKPPRAVAAARKSTDARRLTAKNPTKVKTSDASSYKTVKSPKVAKKSAGRPKKPH